MMNHFNEKRNIAHLWVLFVISPFLTFLISLRYYSSQQYRIFLILFFLLYGYSFVTIPGSDHSGYIETYKEYTTYKYSDFKEIILDTYSANSIQPDFYAPVLLFLTSRVTEDYRFLSLVQAFIYFSVCLALWNSIWKLNHGDYRKLYFIFFVGTIFILNFYAGINGIRWALAFMVYSLGSLKYILSNKLRFLGLAILSVFIHFSLIPAILFLLVFTIIKSFKNINLLFGILILTVIASSLLSLVLTSGASYFGSGIENKLIGYGSENYVAYRESLADANNWYVNFNLKSTYIFVIASMMLLWVRKSKLKFDNISTNLFVFTILLLIQSTITSSILDPITSRRYFLLMALFGLITLYYIGYNNQQSTLIRVLCIFYVPLLILHILVTFRGGLYTVSPFLVFGNVFFILFMKSDINIQDLLLGQ